MDPHAFPANLPLMPIAYSTIGLAPINTREHYLTAAHLGFPSLKGDVRPTKDGGVIMCHDSFFTFDEEGNILPPNRADCTQILDLTTDDILSRVHKNGADRLGHAARVCTMEEYIAICRDTDTICYPTVRDERLDVVLPELFRLLRKYSMTGRTIINSMSYDTLVEARKMNADIALCYTLNGRRAVTREHVDKTIALGRAVLDAFIFPFEERWELMEQSRDAIAYAQEQQVPLYMAQVSTHEDYQRLIHEGFVGFHVTAPYLPYEPKTFKFRLEVKDGCPAYRPGRFAPYTAEVRKEGGRIVLDDIRVAGSGRGFADGLMPLWMNILPYELSVSAESGRTVGAEWRDNAVRIDAGDTDDVLTVTVRV